MLLSETVYCDAFFHDNKSFATLFVTLRYQPNESSNVGHMNSAIIVASNYLLVSLSSMSSSGSKWCIVISCSSIVACMTAVSRR
jgi:hypothetical protein